MFKTLAAEFTGVAASRRAAKSGNRMAQAGQSMVDLVIGISVAVFVAALIIPLAFENFFATDTSSWDAQTILMWAAVPVFALLSVVLAFIFKATRQSD